MRLNVRFLGRLLPVGAAALFLLGDSAIPTLQAQTVAGPFVASLSDAPEVTFAGGTDSNSPAVWEVVDGRRTLHVFNSVNGGVALSAGRNLLRLQAVDTLVFSTAAPLEGYWMEAVVEDGGTWYGYYHNEMHTAACDAPDKVVPRIGAARSYDRGRTWEDLGPVLEMPAEYVRCQTSNQYFLGGLGDFSVMLDPDRQYLYLLYSQYVEADGRMGVSVARMPWANRDAPAGQLAVFDSGAWLPARRVEGGVGGQDGVRAGARAADEAPGSYVYDLAGPIFRAVSRWDDGDGRVDVLWGPSIHWNTFLQAYVILMNQAVSPGFDQGGIFVSYASDLANPKSWTRPVRLLKGGEWYPQVLGLDPGAGTDKLAGETARFYMAGKSAYVIRFGKR